MTIPLTDRAERLASKSEIEPQVILELDGFSEIFGALDVTVLAIIGDDLEIGETWKIGGAVIDPNSKPYISLGEGTSTSITQQLHIDRGGSGSVMRMKLRIVDKNKEISALFSPGNIVADPLSVRGRVYLNFVGGAHPEDSIIVLDGYLADLDFGAGFCDVLISHSEGRKIQEILEKIDTELASNITNSQTSISLLSTDGMLLPQDILRTYIRVNDEVIEYTGISTNTLTGCVRGSLGTTAAAHSNADDVGTFYTLEESAIDLALKLMLSNGGNPFVTGVAIDNFVDPTTSLSVPNSIFFQNVFVDNRYGIVIGDKATSSGASNGANNFSERIIIDIVVINAGSYIVVDGAALILETESSAVMSFRSKYDTLPSGAALNMNPMDVDVPEHERLNELLTTALPNYLFYIKETKKGVDFINQQIYFPAGLYQVPRKGRASVNAALPPLAVREVKTLDENNIKNPSELVIKRSSSDNFYNKVVFRYEVDVLSDQFLKRRTVPSVRSFERIPNLGSRPLNILAEGLRKGVATESAIDTQGRRLMLRYQFGAEFLNDVELLYGVGFNIEVGDAVIFGSEGLQITETEDGNRKTKPKLMEVIKRPLDYKKGKVTVDLLNTAFGLDVRYGVIGPSSLMDSGSTTTKLKLKKSFSTKIIELEKKKWDRYLGEKVLVHSQDWSFQEEVTLVDFDSAQPEIMNITPALSAPPPEDYMVDMPQYSGNVNTKTKWKQFNCFFSPEVAIVSGVSNTEFVVSAGNIGKFFKGGFVRVHLLDYTIDSGLRGIEITSITGNNITVKKSLGFTPATPQVVNLIGFPSDEGKAYAFF